MENVAINDAYTVAILPGVSASVSTGIGSITKPTNTVSKDAIKNEVLFWGDGNDFPQKVIEDVRKDPEIGTLLNKQAGLLYSGGLEWGIPNEKGELIPLPANINSEIKLWLKRTNINRYLLEAAKDLYWFYNFFPEIILQGDRKKIVQICVQPAEECRLGPQNDKTGKIDVCLINAQWPNATASDQLTKKLPVIDSYYDPASQLRESTKNLNFIFPVSHANPGSKFYQLADWNAIRESGWLEVSQAIPQLKKSLLKNQMTIKYHIKISQLYWEKKYVDWPKLDEKQKKEKIEAELKSLNDTLTGAEKAGKSITSVIHHDLNTGKEFDLITISAIDDKLKTGQYLEEGKDASLYKAAAIGLHPALTGLVPNSGLGGAGSNIREAYNLHILTNKPNQDLVLEPLNNLIIEYNGWPSEMEFRFKNQFMTTLDAGRESQPQFNTQK